MKMTAKEALSKIVNYDINDSGKCVADYCEEECEVVAKTLTSYDQLVKEHELTIKLFNSANEQLNELERDVKRFMELDNKLHFDSEDEAIECRVLYRKLRKLGKEE